MLQAALLRHLVDTRSNERPIAVALEAVQRQFQPVLDDYIARRIDEQQLFSRTEWARRWYWSFAAYAPIFRLCRERGVPMVALDVDSEDKATVELGGLAALDPDRLRRYVPDPAGFERFGRTAAFDAYVAYTLRPPYTLMQRVGAKMTASTDAARTMSFANFVDRQSLRDEAMASASCDWLRRNPRGMLVALVGTNHVKFARGVPARAARMLPGGPDAVASVMLNPTPANTFADPAELRLCDRTLAVANEACLRNDIERQNYVLQVPYAPSVHPGEAVPARQGAWQEARAGRSVLALSDYLIFSPPPG